MFKTSSRNRPYARLFSIVLLAILTSTGFILPALPHAAAAQTPPKSAWIDPVNLSNSGSIIYPNLVVDASGAINAIWYEDDIGYSYTSLVDNQWTPPVVTKFPFGEFQPVLAAGEQFIYAFWIDRDRSDLLSFSRVAPEKFSDPKGWSAPQKLSKYVNSVSVSVQPGGHLHVAYMHTLAETDRPEGVVYIRSVDNGSKWTPPLLVYATKYFRSIKPDQVNLQLTATPKGEKDLVSAVWDVPATKRVYYARSVDGGDTWEPAVEVDGPALESELSAPFKIRVAASGDEALRVWQGNLQSGVYCTQFYEYSKDGGRTWTDRQAMLKNVRGCATQNNLMVMSDGHFLLESIFSDETYLTAYNHVLWSDPQIESVLAAFENPVTTELVKFRCQKPVLANTRLYVIGCDEGGPGDAWITWQDIHSVEDWFPKPSAWGIPMQVSSSDDPIYAARGVADSAGRVHMVWTQRVPVPANARGAPEPEKRSIYYAAWDGEKLTEPLQVLESPDGYVGAFALAYDSSRNRLALVWEAGKKGNLYFSWADVAGASSTLEWAAPVSLPLVDPLGRAPDIAVRADGTIFAAYAIPVNEYRGIYLVKSADGGVTWSQPVQVYNAAGSSQMVDSPRLALSGAQSVHLLWAQNTVLSDPGPIGLLYNRSDDDGQTWAAPVSVINEAVSAWWMVDAGETGLLRFWNLKTVQGLNLVQDISLDEGATWSLPVNLTGLGELPRSISVKADAEAGMALSQIVQDRAGRLMLRTQKWNGEDWLLDDNLELDEIAADPLHSLDSEWLPDGRQVVFYAVQQLNHPDGTQPWEIILRVRNPNLQGAAGPTPAASAAATQTQPPEAASPTAASTAATETSSVAISTPQETASVEAGGAQTATPQAAAETPAPPTTATSAGAEITPTPQATPEIRQTPLSNTPQETGLLANSNFGLIVAGAISLVVAGAFVVYTRYRRSR